MSKRVGFTVAGGTALCLVTRFGRSLSMMSFPSLGELKKGEIAGRGFGSLSFVFSSLSVFFKLPKFFIARALTPDSSRLLFSPGTFRPTCGCSS